MNRMLTFNPRPGRSLERGYSMVELSVALLIAMFLLVGMFMILQTTRQTSSNQTGLAQLQENERVAMTMMTDVIQQAGYYPNAQTNPITTAFPADTLFTFTGGGQTITGTTATTSTGGDTISVRYMGDSTNNVLDCLGSTLANNNTPEDMTFSVQADTSNGGALELFCQVGTNTPVPLVPNVTQMKILYGVDTAAVGSAGAGGANTYLTSTGITSLIAGAPTTNYWSNVYSVQLQLTFLNPLYPQPGQQQTLTFTRVIGIMTMDGVNVTQVF